MGRPVPDDPLHFPMGLELLGRRTLFTSVHIFTNARSHLRDGLKPHTTDRAKGTSKQKETPQIVWRQFPRPRYST